MSYYLGVDMGTTATKAVAFSTTGEIMAIEVAYYGMSHPEPGWSEQDPEEILQRVVASINKIVAALAPQTPAFISFSAAMHSLLAIDEKGHPLTASMTWADNRAYAIAGELHKAGHARRFYQATGVPVHSMSPLCKLLWLKQHKPAVFTAAAKFIGIKEYVFGKLFGQYIVDTSIASATGILNLESLAWEEPILQFIGIRSDQLSQVVDTRQVLYYDGQYQGLSIPVQTPVVIGASDGALSNLGTVAGDSRALVATIGTSGAVRMIVHQPQTDALMRTFCYHVKDKEFIIGGATNNGAVVLQWLKESLLNTEESLEELIALAQTVAPGSEGLLCLPYLLGERAPVWNAHARGVFFGCSIRHEKAHLVRAAMEGVIYCLYSIANVLFEKQEVPELYVSGGFARSALWLQIMADVFNKKVLVSGTVESSAMGAVIVGAEALGVAYKVDRKIEAVYGPDPEHHAIYRKGFEQFQRLYELLKDEMSGEGSPQSTRAHRET